MIFTSASFAIFFAFIYVALLLVRNDVARRWILLGGSLFFYGFWNAWYLLLILAVTLWSYLLGLYIADSQPEAQKRAGVTIGVILSLSALAIFKYSGFFAANIAGLVGLKVPAFIANIVLPVGISFYTFHSISYYVDVYRKQVPVARSLRDYALYIVFFPQLVAGPIVRASQFLPQLARPVLLTRENFAAGARLFLVGAVQKLLFADTVSPFVDQVFATPTLYSTSTDWLGVLGYALQIFGDFSGYTLMAIGIARILGYRLPDNFRMPYISRSVSEFWQRWHITLSFFLRDYLYIPLGGNRRGFMRAQVNVMVTMLLGGLWHGSSWNFVIWGGIHGGAIVVHRLWERFLKPYFAVLRAPVFLSSALAWSITFLVVILAWIPFRAVTFAKTMAMATQLFHPASGISWHHIPTLVALSAAALWHVLHVLSARGRCVALVGERWMYVFEVSAMTTLLLLFAPTSTSPFIYFQF